MRLMLIRLMLGVLLATPIAVSVTPSRAASDADVRQIVAEELQKVFDPEGPGGSAIALRLDGRTLFFNFGSADTAGDRPVTSDSLFNLASLSKVIDTTMLSMMIVQGEVSLDDPIVNYIPELQKGRDIRQVTIGQLVSYTSGLTLPQDHPPWPAAHYTLPRFLAYLNKWRLPRGHKRGKDYIYSHAGFMLLHVALERRFETPYIDLLDQRLLSRLGLPSTTLPLRGSNSVGNLAPELLSRAVQGHDDTGAPVGKPGDMQGYYFWPGTGQMYSSARDLSTFLALHLGEGPPDPLLREAVELSHREIATICPGVTQAQAWEIHKGAATIIDKYGALNNTSGYIGMIPASRIGIVMLINRGETDVSAAGRRIMQRLALPAGTEPQELICE
jgi:beta-lactamase class C